MRLDRYALTQLEKGFRETAELHELSSAGNVHDIWQGNSILHFHIGLMFSRKHCEVDQASGPSRCQPSCTGAMKEGIRRRDELFMRLELVVPFDGDEK